MSHDIPKYNWKRHIQAMERASACHKLFKDFLTRVYYYDVHQLWRKAEHSNLLKVLPGLSASCWRKHTAGHKMKAGCKAVLWGILWGKEFQWCRARLLLTVGMTPCHGSFRAGLPSTGQRSTFWRVPSVWRTGCSLSARRASHPPTILPRILHCCSALFNMLVTPSHAWQGELYM